MRVLLITIVLLGFAKQSWAQEYSHKFHLTKCNQILMGALLYYEDAQKQTDEVLAGFEDDYWLGMERLEKYANIYQAFCKD